jgi:hypothetical protein
MALKQTAFEQQFFAVDLDEIHGAGGGARRAKEMDFHFGDLRLTIDDLRLTSKPRFLGNS